MHEPAVRCPKPRFREKVAACWTNYGGDVQKVTPWVPNAWYPDCSNAGAGSIYFESICNASVCSILVSRKPASLRIAVCKANSIRLKTQRGCWHLACTDTVNYLRLGRFKWNIFWPGHEVGCRHDCIHTHWRVTIIYNAFSRYWRVVV